MTDKEVDLPTGNPLLQEGVSSVDDRAWNIAEKETFRLEFAEGLYITLLKLHVDEENRRKRRCPTPPLPRRRVPPTPPPPPLTYGSEDDEAIRFTVPFGWQWDMRAAPPPPSDPSAPASATASDTEGSPASPGNPPSVHDLLLNAAFALIALNERPPPGLCGSPVAETPVDSEHEDGPSDYDCPRRHWPWASTTL